jgi:MarR family 2-MHQ and catechol resistance regulon transcriptional repressor
MSAKNDSSKRDKAHRKRRRAAEVYGRLQRAAALTSAAADGALAPFGLSASQFGVLEAIDARGPQHQQELARFLGRSKAQMTAIIDALQKRDLATREPHPTDRRYTTIHLTGEGRALLAQAAPVRADALLASLTGLNGDNRQRLSRLCRRLIKALAPDDTTGDEDAAEDGPDSGVGDAAGDTAADTAREGVDETPGDG